jgi:hypothetical protein
LKPSQQDHGESQMDERREAFTTAIPAGHHALVLVQPGEQALDLPTAVIAPQGATILGRDAVPVAAVQRNQLDALGREPLIERSAAPGASTLELRALVSPTVRR